MEGARIKATEVPTEGDVYLTGDLGFSLSKYRDPSSFTLHKTVKDTFYCLLQSTGHWNDAGKAEEIVRLARMYPGSFQKCILEKYPGCEGLEKEIQKAAWKYNVTIPLFWLPTSNDAEAKFRRLKNNVELAVYNGKVRFVIPPEGSPNWIEDLIVELLKLDNTGPKRRSSTIRDDRGDSLSLAVKYFLRTPEDSDAEEMKQLQEREQDSARRAEQYRLIFGSQSQYVDWKKLPQTEEIESPMASQDSPIFRALSIDPRNKKPQKTLSFAFMKERPINN